MKRKKLAISSLIVSLLLSLAATSFAGIGIHNNRPDVGTEAGIDTMASPKALAAAANYDYSSYSLGDMGTEAGAEVIASEKARIAAATFDYSGELFAWVDTEAGHPPIGVHTYETSGTGGALEYIAGKDKSDTDIPCRC